MNRFLFIVFALLCVVPIQSRAADDPAVLVIILDGLRPDYVTPEIMPTLNALAEEGVFAENHHAAIPTVTRVNSPSLATGTYPSTHGLMGNSVYFPEIDPAKGLSTSSSGSLMNIEKETGGNLLTTITMGEHLEALGKEIFVVSSGSAGSAYLLNHKGKGRGIVHRGVILPESRRDEVMNTLGPVPEDAAPNEGRNAWAVDSFFMEIDQNGLPDLTYMWLSDPDHTAHEKGIGAPETLRALKLVDLEIARILETITDAGLKDRLNILVTADHGFSTHSTGTSLSRILKRNKLDKDVVIVGGAVYLRSGNKKQIASMVAAFQNDPAIGAIFTRADSPGSEHGWVEGTLSHDLIHWNHERAGDILVTANWSHAKNKYGYAGTTSLSGVAGHGTLSPYDIHATLIANGPAFKSAKRSQAPTANVDIAPTVCRILGIPSPEQVDGRVLEELLRNLPDTPANTVRTNTYRVSKDGYSLQLRTSSVGEHRYIDHASVTRQP
ncbi:MAG TPA: alkaline phosphatase family protein [Candidatus Hydrogenedentes bacterium]|nr:alkaline phosphatase family protein [Candidatus Hydrogenedentota bacterium]